MAVPDIVTGRSSLAQGDGFGFLVFIGTIGLIIAIPLCIPFTFAATRVMEDARRTRYADALWAGAAIGLLVGGAELLLMTGVPAFLSQISDGYGYSSSIGGQPMVVDGVPTAPRLFTELALMVLTIPIGVVAAGVGRLALGQPRLS
jgi:hypothetical protein